MLYSIFETIGGIGLFLVGMSILTKGLRAIAGDRLRKMLRQMTRSPVSGVVTGTVSTAILQSSSATTIATIGFVGAGLLTFPQALGVIFGANIGTTVTGWMVALLGFKLKLGTVVMPLILVGVLLRLFARGWLKHAGWAMAGFCLLFFGITAMQHGMVAFQGLITPADFPADTVGGRLLMVLLGVLITLITQSSSAGVATALAALSIDAMTFTQAAAMVIGMDVGTTFTAALATIGGSVTIRRTGYAHVIYNLLTGVMAFLLLIPLSWMVETGGAPIFDPQVGLVLFHSTFNFLGVLAVIGFTPQFARFMTRIIPATPSTLTEKLDRHLLSDAQAAIDAAAAALQDIAHALFGVLSDLLAHNPDTDSYQKLHPIGDAINAARSYAAKIRLEPEQDPARNRHIAIMHSLDHVWRLYHRCRQIARAQTVAQDAALAESAQDLCEQLRHYLKNQATEVAHTEEVNRLRKKLRHNRQPYRESVIYQASAGTLEMPKAMAKLEAMRWLHRVSYHVWRLMHYSSALRRIDTPAAPIHEPDFDGEEDRVPTTLNETGGQ